HLSPPSLHDALPIFTGNVTNAAGHVSPGPSSGLISMTGNYNQGVAGALDIDLGGPGAGTEFDQVNVVGGVGVGGVGLRGTLTVRSEEHTSELQSRVE